ncbi:juvenile hormone epoxide hydrolase 2 [Trichoderma arundinaceum]|uniref:Juvenile hormone epoxide hydrolase 2 n=1 Tax=Trichoderma arundinaceum TaxID=490622 RepID=A0A395P4D1_TRIAR|nr:juvenile hormone epoxide hydrolase 2 [Trichoderma arundinaceum]
MADHAISPAPLTLTEEDLRLTFNATYTDAVAPFRISVKQDFLDQTRLKASLTRFVETEYQPPNNEPEFTDGPPTHAARTIASHWANAYDWRAVENDLNNQLKQFTTIVYTPNTPYKEPIPLHFVHHRSPRSDAIPLLFVHGWPGSFLEVAEIIQLLTHPPSDSVPAFHVVAPSIPGYGFSPSPRAPGFGYRQAAAAFNVLMRERLGYTKYVVQGGDAGDFINRYAAVDFPEAVVAVHANFWIVPPTDEDREKLKQGKSTEEEAAIIARLDGFSGHRWAYGHLHQTQPLRLAPAMTDSPVGLAMWIYDVVVMCVEEENVAAIWTPDRVITWTMMHWIPGPYAAFSLYRHGAADGAISVRGIEALPYVHQPVAISQFPHDVWYRTPLEWAKRTGNVKQNTVYEKGGHFPALETPEVLVKDMWQFFGNPGKSGTGVFGWRNSTA